MSRSIGVAEDVAAYVRAMNRDEHPALARCRKETQARVEDAVMQISPEQGAFMAFLARLTGAKSYVEVGVFTGYSALAMGLTLKEMHGAEASIVACDISEEFIAEARKYWTEAGVEDLIDVRIGPAVESLATLPDASTDLMFVDADKAAYPAYYDAGARLLRPGGVMLFDNVLWSGSVADENRSNADIDGLRETAGFAKGDERFDIAFTTIGDGLLLCRKK